MPYDERGGQDLLQRSPSDLGLRGRLAFERPSLLRAGSLAFEISSYTLRQYADNICGTLPKINSVNYRISAYRVARLTIAILALFLLAEPNPDPATGVFVEEADPRVLRG